MRPQDFSSLALSRYELRLEARQSASLPSFLGSTLLDAFGHALKEAVCIMRHRDCSHYLVADRCIYPYLFETPAPADLPQLRGQQQAPHPFILAPPGLLKSAHPCESRLDVDYRGLIARAADARIHQASLSWHDWERYSNRQETKMKLGGFIGEIEYEGDVIGDFLPLLVAGEILHVGAGTSFGLGKYHKEAE